jgi:Cellulase (glycosyl hydrolase family 5)
MRRTNIVLLFVILVLVVVAAGFAVFIIQQLQKPGSTGPTATGTGTPTASTPFVSNMPHAQGDHLVDSNGNLLTLRGAQIETSLNYIKQWNNGERPTNTLNSAVFNSMVHDWKMNAFRLPLSNWMYAKYTAEYMSQVDQIVQEANSAGLYVILDLHDDKQSGSIYADKAAELPKTEDIPFWKAIATHFKNNSMVMFDVYNEPKDPNWQVWLHGGGTFGGATAVGFQDLVDAIRSTGAKQVIVVEPGSAGKHKGQSAIGLDVAEESGWATVGNHSINDPNIMYSLHIYDGIMNSPQQLAANWGPILGHYPIYYGEWAFLPNTGIAAHCQNLPTNPTQSTQVVQGFLDYMASHNANWTAWQFAPHFLVRNYSNFTPTTLNISWTCGNTKQPTVGMGEVVKSYLMSHVLS